MPSTAFIRLVSGTSRECSLVHRTDHDVGSESGRVRFQLDRLVALSYLTFSEAGLKGFKRLAPEIVPVVGSRLE